MKTARNICIVLLLCLLDNQSFAQKITLLTYNTMKGFERQKEEKKTAFINWVKTINPDIICFQELNTFTQPVLEEFAAQYGHAYAVLLKETGSSIIGITSRYPITNVKKIFNSEGLRGFIHAEIKGYHIFTMHLYPAPHNFDLRKAEIETVLQEAANIPAGQKILFAGDFNAYSEVDKPLYCNTLRIASDRQTASKVAGVTEQQINGIPDFKVLRMLPAAGYTDAFWQLNHHTETSFPTVGYELAKPNRQSRLDYVWLNSALSGKCIRAEIMKNSITDALSDHYPLLIELEE